MHTKKVALLVAALALVAAPDLQAQVEVEFAPFLGGTMFLADPPNRFALGHRVGAPVIIEEGQFDDAWTLGFNAGFRFSERWAVEGMFSWLPTRLTAREGLDSPTDVNGFMYGVTALFYLPLQGPVYPFVGLGVGAETFDYDLETLETDTEWMGNVAAGLFVEVNDMMGVRFELRDCFARFESGLADVDNAWEHDLMATVGLSFRAPLGR